MAISNEMGPADVRACTEGANGYGNGMGWGGEWLIWIVLFAVLFGWGGNGWGGGFGGRNGAGVVDGYVLASDFSNIERKIDGVNNGVCDGFYAMNTGMLENPITQDNLATLERYGFTVIPSESGVLACKDVGSGRLPKEDVLLEYILHTIARPKDLAGLRIAVTAGPTQEALDPVRYLTNHSTGKMGYALARAAAMRGADVTLIHGETALQPVRFTTDVPVTTAQQMYEAVTSRFEDTDVLIMAAAVADYRPAAVANDKIKKKDGDMSIPLERTPDILGTIGPRKAHQFLCGFSMETRDLVENSSAKLTRKNLDMVVANNLKVAGAGFGVDTNVVTLITPDGARELPLMSKADVADAILDEILKRKNS